MFFDLTPSFISEFSEFSAAQEKLDVWLVVVVRITTGVKFWEKGVVKLVLD